MCISFFGTGSSYTYVAHFTYSILVSYTPYCFLHAPGYIGIYFEVHYYTSIGYVSVHDDFGPWEHAACHGRKGERSSHRHDAASLDGGKKRRIRGNRNYIHWA